LDSANRIDTLHPASLKLVDRGRQTRRRPAIVSGVPSQSWVTLIVGGLASIGALVTWQQKNRADKRSEWWRRTTWAFERTCSIDDAEAGLGWKVLDTLMRSKLATKDDSDIVQVIAEQVALGVSGQEDSDGNAARSGRP
jgi:hypothetical protein